MAGRFHPPSNWRTGLYPFRWALILLTWGNGGILAPAVPPGYMLTWSDEFTNNFLNTNYWNYAGSGWRNQAYNTSNAVSVSNGCLVITTYTQNGTNYTGFIDTQNKVMNRYGYYEASIQFSNAPANWSAFWIQSPYVGNTNNNPTNGVEIDIFEHRQIDQSGTLWVNGGDHALHWDGYSSQEQSASWASANLGVATGFHAYGLLWTPTNYVFSVDGTPTWTTTNMVSSAFEFIRLTSEVHTNTWAGNLQPGGYLGLTNSPYQMRVNYVRYYVPTNRPVLQSGSRPVTGQFALKFNGPSAQGFHLLMSTNPWLPATNWSLVTTGSFSGNWLSVTDNAATNARRFYRVTSP